MEFKVNSISITEAMDAKGEITRVKSVFLYSESGNNFCYTMNNPRPEDEKLFELGGIYELVRKT